MGAADELMQMFMARQDLVDGIGRDEEPTRWLLNAIHPFSKIDLASAIGALHLMPVNMEHAVRLHRLAHVCAAAEARPGEPAMTLHRLRAITNAGQLNGLAGLEDPFENPFTEHFGFNSEDFIVLNGPVESEAFGLGCSLTRSPHQMRSSTASVRKSCWLSLRSCACRRSSRHVRD